MKSVKSPPDLAVGHDDGRAGADPVTAPSDRPPARRRPRRHPRSTLAAMPGWVLLAAIGVVFAFPLLWATVASVSPQPGTAQTEGWGLGNYRTLLEYQDGALQYLWNSTVVSGLTVLLTLFVATLGGYAFARFSFPGRNVLFIATLAILMVPYATLLIPLYVVLNQVGLQNSLIGLALVMSLFQLPFAVFMMRISFEAVPRELDEAAIVDGCSAWGVLRHVLLPAVRPGLVTVGLFAFLAAWNDFITPLILITDSTKSPLPLAVTNMRQQVQGVVDYGATEAGVVVLALPCVLLFLFLQRHYVRGFMSGALKG